MLFHLSMLQSSFHHISLQVMHLFIYLHQCMLQKILAGWGGSQLRVGSATACVWLPLKYTFFMALETWHELCLVVNNNNKRLLVKLKPGITILQVYSPCIEMGFSC